MDNLSKDYKITDGEIYLCYSRNVGKCYWYYIKNKQWYCDGITKITMADSISILNNDLITVKKKIRQRKLKRILNG